MCVFERSCDGAKMTCYFWANYLFPRASDSLFRAKWQGSQQSRRSGRKTTSHTGQEFNGLDRNQNSDLTVSGKPRWNVTITGCFYSNEQSCLKCKNITALRLFLCKKLTALVDRIMSRQKIDFVISAWRSVAQDLWHFDLNVSCHC